jgi:nicotinate phosphoribosyltransferase
MDALFTDCYELAMANADFEAGKQDEIGYFDVFFRRIPENGGYVIAAGLEKAIQYLENLKFTEKQISFLQKTFSFSDKYIDALRNFELKLDIWAVKEGTPVFPNEPLMIVRGPMWQAMLVEVAILNCIAHQSLVATRASRVVRAARGRKVMEFGARRAQGEAAAIWGARAAYIGGVDGVSVVKAGMKFGMPVGGTMAHSFVQKYDSDYEAFAAYARAFPDDCILLLDTFDTLKSGLPASIRVQREILEPLGKKLKAVRIDSGDLGYLSKELRRAYDKTGMEYVQIIASNSLDEALIQDIICEQEAPIDMFGVGENLITSRSSPILGAIYKLSAVEKNGVIEPRIKISDTAEKMTIPAFKTVYRLFDNKTNKAIADLITLADEPAPSSPYELFDPADPRKRKTVKDFTAEPLLAPIFESGKLVYDLPNTKEIREYAKEQLDTLWDEVKRFNFPHIYYVDLSQKLWDLRDEMIRIERGADAK